jgi:ribosomal protein S18 acetylase RimI-like enzyme
MSVPTIEIRTGRADESAAVLDFWRRAAARPSPTDTPAQVLAAPQASLLVAVDGRRIVGTVIAGWDGWRGNIYRLTVDPDYRRRGLARALVARADEELRRRGARRITALVELDHPWAVGFWTSLRNVGYEQEPRTGRWVKMLP